MNATPSTRRRLGALAFLVAVAVAALVWVIAAQSASSASRTAGPVGEADGVLPEGVTADDERHPGVTRLDPELLAALRAAADDAARDGVELIVTSGWRTPAYQQQLLDDAVAHYGSEAEAARWVASPETSAHVSGDAVDIGPTAAWLWLSEHGAAYGLCQSYANELWHFELRPEATAHGCPEMYLDPTDDPRLNASAR